MTGVEAPTMHRRPLTAMFALACVGLFAQIPADRGTAEEVYTRVRPVRHLVPDEPPYVKLPVIPRDRRLRGDLLRPMDSTYNIGNSFYTTVPIISNDGKLAFFFDSGFDGFAWSMTAVLLDIDRSSVIWERILYEDDECNINDPACVEVINLRQQAINRELATHDWVWPELWGGADPSMNPQCACGALSIYASPKEFSWPELTVTFASPRLLVVAANGTVLVDKRFPSHTPSEPPPVKVPCEKTNFPNIRDAGFDRERRVFFISFHYCSDFCDHPKRIIHIFRMPKL